MNSTAKELRLLFFLVYVQINVVAIGILALEVAQWKRCFFNSVIAQSTFISSKRTKSATGIGVQLPKVENIACSVNLVALVQQHVMDFVVGTGSLKIRYLS